MLRIENLSVHYGMIQAVHDVSFEVNQGEIVSLIGANGAGKTTILRTISGLIRPSKGTILFEGKPIQKEAPQKSLLMDYHKYLKDVTFFQDSPFKKTLRWALLRKDNQVKEDYQQVFTKFPVLKERLSQDASTLSGGEQQMLAMGRALMSKPRLLLLDEPSMGLAPIFIKEIFSIIQEIKQQGTTVLLIEQNAKMALSIADRGYVLETGKIVLQGSGQELLESDEVKKAYLGG